MRCSRAVRYAGLILLLLALPACAVRPAVHADPPPALASTATQAATLPPLPPTRTATPVPTATQTPQATLSPTATAAPTLAPQPVSPAKLQGIGVENASRLERLAWLPRPAPGTQPAFALSPDGKTIAQGSGQAVRLWDIRKGQVMRVLTSPGDLIQAGGALAFAPDGLRLARIYGPNTLVIWDTATGEVVQQVDSPPSTGALSELAYAGGAKAPRLVASGLRSGQPGMFFWDALSGDLLAESTSGAAEVDPFIVSPNGRMVVQAGRDGVVRFWNGVTGQAAGQQIIYACPDSLLGANFNESGGLLTLACDPASDTQARLRLFFYSPAYYRPDAMTLFKVFTSDAPSSGLVTFSVDSSLVGVTSGNAQMGSRANQLELWGFYTHRHIATLSVIWQDIRQAEFSRDGKLLLLALSDGSIEIWGIPQAL